MIQNHKLLIDQDCPMCVGYSKVFTTANLISQETTSPYQTIEEKFSQHIDMHRAKNEIALFNTKNNKTIYGIDAMIEIVSHRSKILQQILRFKPVRAMLNVLYKFISYNRKIILGSKPTNTNRDCTPDVNYTYRIAYILFAALFTGVVLNLYIKQMNTGFGINTPWFVEYLICFGQVAWQGIMITLWSRKNTLDYLGNMSAVSAFGGVGILLFYFVFQFIPVSSVVMLGTFFGIVLCMLIEHLRRCKNLGIGLLPTISWLTFRTVVLVLLFLFFFQYQLQF